MLIFEKNMRRGMLAVLLAAPLISTSGITGGTTSAAALTAFTLSVGAAGPDAVKPWRWTMAPLQAETSAPCRHSTIIRLL